MPVYISCGEDFEDPFQQTKRNAQCDTLWLSDGVRLLGNASEHTTKQLENNDGLVRTIKLRKRLVAFINGQEFKPTVVPFEVKNPESTESGTEEDYLNDFLLECTDRLRMIKPALKVFNWLGDRVDQIEHIPKLDECLQELVCDTEYSPVWVSKGELFDAYGALRFVEKLISDAKTVRKDFTNRKVKLQEVGDGLKKNNKKPIKKYVKLQILENSKSIKKLKIEIEKVTASITNLKSIQEHLNSLYQKQKDLKAQNATNFHHFLHSKKPLKLTVCVNGGNEDDPFNVLIDPQDLKMFDHVLTEIDKAFYRHNSSVYIKFTRIFDENGKELTQMDYEQQGKQIWISTGEDWKDPRLNLTFALSMNLKMLAPVPNTQTPMNPSEDQTTEQNNPDQEDHEPSNETNLPVTPFETSGLYAFKTILEDLRIDLLKNYCKGDEWDVLTENESSQRITDLVVSDPNSAASAMFVDYEREINQKKALQLILQARNDQKLFIYPQVKCFMIY